MKSCEEIRKGGIEAMIEHLHDSFLNGKPLSYILGASENITEHLKNEVNCSPCECCKDRN